MIFTLSTATVTIENNDSEYRTCTVATDINKEGGWCRSELRETGDGNLCTLPIAMYYFSICTDLLILGFEQDTYQVSEANNSVVVCVNITDSIERSVVINLQTMDGTAQG